MFNDYRLIKSLLVSPKVKWQRRENISCLNLLPAPYREGQRPVITIRINSSPTYARFCDYLFIDFLKNHAINEKENHLKR